jgi:hypothetical protein
LVPQLVTAERGCGHAVAIDDGQGATPSVAPRVLTKKLERAQFY